LVEPGILVDRVNCGQSLRRKKCFGHNASHPTAPYALATLEWLPANFRQASTRSPIPRPLEFGLLFHRSGNLWMIGMLHGLGVFFIDGLPMIY
jgi:hypothetical protein